MPVSVDLWLTSTDAWRHRQDALLANLSQGERTRSERFVDPHIGQRFAIGRGLLRVVLGRRLSIDPAAVQFQVAALGKPSLAAAHGSELSFNASAFQDRLAIALCETCDVGVDIEGDRSLSDAIFRSATVLSAGERAQLAALSGQEKTTTFLRWWARKEAVAKADGRGVSMGLHHIDGGSRAFDDRSRTVQAGGRSFLTCDCDRIAGSYCTVATAGSGRDQALAIRYIDDKDVVV